MELFAMVTGMALVALCVWQFKAVREANELEDRVAELEEKVNNLHNLTDIAEGLVDFKAQEYEKNWQEGVTNILGYDMSDARKAVSDE